MSADLSLIDVSAARNGDREAFGRIVNATRNTVCSIAYAILRDIDRSEDCAQDVYLSAWQGMAKLKEPASFLPWLRQITRHRAADIHREQAREKGRRVLGESADLLITAHPDAAADARLLMQQAQETAALEEALAGLDTETREILCLYYREEQSTKSVAALLDLSEVAVRKRLSRAREVLRASLLDQFAAHARRSAPTAALTTAVLAALPIALPTTAAAASAAMATSTVGNSAAKGLLAPFGVLVGTFLIAASGILFGAWLESRRTTDAVELATIRRVVKLCLFFSFTSGLLWTAFSVWPSDLLAIAAYLWLLGGLYWSIMIVNVRGKQQRYAQELALEGAAAATRHRRESFFRWFGFIAGATIGGGTLLVGLLIR